MCEPWRIEIIPMRFLIACVMPNTSGLHDGTLQSARLRKMKSSAEVSQRFAGSCTTALFSPPQSFRGGDFPEVWGHPKPLPWRLAPTRTPCPCLPPSPNSGPALGERCSRAFRIFRVRAAINAKTLRSRVLNAKSVRTFATRGLCFSPDSRKAYRGCSSPAGRSLF